MPYQPSPAAYDEAITPDGAWRPHVAEALNGAGGPGLADLAPGLQEAADRAGMSFVTPGGSGAFVIDPVPRIFTAGEWDLLDRGLAQRVRALDAFVADVHGPCRTVVEGVVPERVIATAEHHEPEARSAAPPAGVWIAIAGPDVVRDPDGAFRVLEDNVRTPSGIAYTLATRRLVGEAMDARAARPVDDAIALLAGTLAAAAPPGRADDGPPRVVVLTDGPTSSAFWEHRTLADALGAPLVTPDRLALRGDRLVVRGTPDTEVDVVYRRTDDSSIAAASHALLRRALTAGTVGIVNGFGTGVADDKLVHAYVEDLIRFHLGEEPLLPSVRTFDLEAPGCLEEALDRLDELVVKPRGGSGGHGVVICAHGEAGELEAVRAELLAEPGAFVAQDLVTLSTHPTAVDGRLEPRHVDLRPFVFVRPGGDVRVLPGGLTRVALREGSMIVNSTQDGGAKDTWVLR